jgi:hypothetical protein
VDGQEDEYLDPIIHEYLDANEGKIGLDFRL